MFDWFWTMFSLGAPDVRWTSTEIPHWWRINTQTWAVLLIGRAAWEICFNQSESLSCDTSSVWNFCARSSDVIVTAKVVVVSRYLGCFLKLRTGCRCSIQVSSFYLSWLRMKMIKSLTLVNSSNDTLESCCRLLLLRIPAISSSTWSSVSTGPVTILNKLNNAWYDNCPLPSVSRTWNATAVNKP